jgi:hypothetical protein
MSKTLKAIIFCAALVTTSSIFSLIKRTAETKKSTTRAENTSYQGYTDYAPTDSGDYAPTFSGDYTPTFSGDYMQTGS